MPATTGDYRCRGCRLSLAGLEVHVCPLEADGSLVYRDSGRWLGWPWCAVCCPSPTHDRDWCIVMSPEAAGD